MSVVLGIGMAAASGMKMVLIMECLGRETLRSFLAIEQGLSLPLAFFVPMGKL